SEGWEFIRESTLLQSEFGGRRCELINLNQRADLMGKTCVVMKYLPRKDRYKIKMEHSDESFLVGPDNLKRRDRTPDDPGELTAEQRRGAAGVPGKDKKKGKKGKKKSPEEGQSWTFPQAAALKQPPLAAVSPIAVQYNPPGPAGDELELAVVLKSFPGDKHLPELDGDGLVVHVTIEAEQFCIRGSQIPVLSNLPRRFTFGGYEESTGFGRRLVVYVSTTAEVACETSFDGTATPIQWDADEHMSVEVRDIIDAAAKTNNVRAGLLESYGCVVDVPQVMTPTTDELLNAQRLNDDYTLREWHDRITDQHHSFSIAERLLDRCVCNFRRKSKEHFLNHQERAKKRKAAETRAAGNSAEREDGVLLNFDALNDRHTNSVMNAARDKYLEEVAHPMFKILKKNGEAVTHGCENNQDINYGHPVHRMNTKQPLVYYAHDPTHEIHKSGSCGNGALKEDILNKRFADSYSGETIQYYKAVGLSHISPELQKEKLSPLLLDGLRKFRCPRAPKTLLEAILYDMTGLSLGFQLHAMAVTEPYDANELCSGALNVTGFLYNHYRMAMESGYQLDLTAHGLHHTGAMFEHLMSGGAGLFEAEEGGIQDFVQTVHDDLVADDSNDYSNKSKLAREIIWLAWKAGRLKTCPSKFRSAKELVAEAVGGGKGQFDDAFGEQVPVVDPETFDECHAFENFSLEQCKDAVANTEANVIEPVEMNGGLRVLDVNQVAFDRIKKRKRGKMAGTDDIDCEDKMPAMTEVVASLERGPGRGEEEQARRDPSRKDLRCERVRAHHMVRAAAAAQGQSRDARPQRLRRRRGQNGLQARERLCSGQRQQPVRCEAEACEEEEEGRGKEEESRLFQEEWMKEVNTNKYNRYINA
ncbi:hypothetical protein THAOC_36443, partial [Thalassiosira oceanica]